MDGWGNEIQFRPFDNQLGFGVVCSFGSDGKPGGEHSKADIEVRFGKDRIKEVPNIYN